MAKQAERGTFAAQWRWLSWALMAIVAVAVLIVAAAGDEGPQSDGERVSELAATIRCPQCRGQSVAESNVTIAREIRADIRTRVAAGETDDEIRQVYIDRFGRSVVLTPDATGFTGLVWIVPVVAAGLAVAAVAVAFQRWRAEADEIEQATDEDRELVAQLRAERDDQLRAKRENQLRAERDDQLRAERDDQLRAERESP